MDNIGVAEQEAVKREVNEAIESGLPTQGGATARMRCECGSPDCIAFVNIPISDYEQVRQHPRRFVVATGHVVHAVEHVVDRNPVYEVVEKVGEAGELVERADPRTASTDEPPTL